MDDILLFVHGTGVRQSGYTDTMDNLRKGMKKAGLGHVRIEGIPWGDEMGTSLGTADIDDVLPPTKTRGEGSEDWEAALWAQLLEDPLLELRMAALRRPPAPLPAGGVVIPGVQSGATVKLDPRFDRLRSTLADPLPGGVNAAEIREAANWLALQPVLREAEAASTAVEEPDLIHAVARAIVAMVLIKRRGELGAGPSALYVAGERLQLVETVVSALSPATRGIKSWLFDKVKDFAEARATSVGKTRRRDLMNSGSPGVGDILFYQRRGDGILSAIEKRIDELSAGEAKLVVLGHSLGGIMLVDLLSRPRAAGKWAVKRLITVGSQSPMLLKCDALGSMRLNEKLPQGSPFSPWLNVYDRNDFLSFCGSRAFPGVTHGIEDFEVASGVPFPDSHGAYFHLDALYKKIAEVWP